MSTKAELAPKVIDVATSGIQDISALLPLLGTEQCEKLVSSALRHGFFYAAATPMSIFGSPGIVKAGFVVLWGSIDHPFFSGPKRVHNAGVIPSGIGKLLVPVAKDNRQIYLAEEKIQGHLSKVNINSVEINLFSRDLWLWNLLMIGMTALLSGLGLLSYVYIIRKTPPNASLQSTWLYPVMRTLGCGLVAVMIQLIFQRQIIEEVYHRLRFIATDNCLKAGKESIPSFWDPNRRSKGVLRQLQQSGEVRNLQIDKRPLKAEDIGVLTRFDVPASLVQDSDVEGGCCNPVPAVSYYYHWVSARLPLWTARLLLLFGLIISVVGYIGCFSVVQKAPESAPRASLIWLGLETALAVARLGFWAWNPAWDDAGDPIVLTKEARKSQGSQEDVTKESLSSQEVANSKDPEITYEKNAATESRGSQGVASSKVVPESSYGVGWMLESVTANDVQALIVGINGLKMEGLKETPQPASDAEEVANYLQKFLLVPASQITTLTNDKATKGRIRDELKALSHRAEKDAPILIYFSTDSLMDDDKNEAHLILGTDNADGGDTISYREIVELLGCIGEGKTENITLILECPHAGHMEKDGNTEPNKSGDLSGAVHPMAGHTRRPGLQTATEELIGHSSHILLAGTGSGGGGHGQTDSQWQLTSELLKILRSEEDLPKMTYKDLVERLNGQRQEKPKRWWLNLFGRSNATPAHTHDEFTNQPRAFCTTLYQNRPLFNGLFSHRITTAQKTTPVITVRYSDRKGEARSTEL